MCVCVCESVRGNKKSIENILVNAVYNIICGDYQESKQFSKNLTKDIEYAESKFDTFKLVIC